MKFFRYDEEEEGTEMREKIIGHLGHQI